MRAADDGLGQQEIDVDAWEHAVTYMTPGDARQVERMARTMALARSRPSMARKGGRRQRLPSLPGASGRTLSMAALGRSPSRLAMDMELAAGAAGCKDVKVPLKSSSGCRILWDLIMATLLLWIAVSLPFEMSFVRNTPGARPTRAIRPRTAPRRRRACGVDAGILAPCAQTPLTVAV